MAKSFEIKSAQLPLVALHIKSADLKHVARELIGHFGPSSESPEFFDNDPMVIDFSHTQGEVSALSLQALLQSLNDCRLWPLAFRGAAGTTAAAALSLGLIETTPEQTRVPTAPSLATKSVEVVREVVHEIPGPPTMVVDKPLRSGQKIYARGADLVVLAMVNMGAEVVADGNIHVYAPLRGKAMAGASGNTRARIFSLCLEPELISIAGVYRTSEHPLPHDIQGKPAQVHLSDDGQEKLIFAALNP